MKRVLAIAAIVVGSIAAFAVPASADTLCVTTHVQINDTVNDQAQCV